MSETQHADPLAQLIAEPLRPLPRALDGARAGRGAGASPRVRHRRRVLGVGRRCGSAGRSLGTRCGRASRRTSATSRAAQINVCRQLRGPLGRGPGDGRPQGRRSGRASPATSRTRHLRRPRRRGERGWPRACSSWAWRRATSSVSTCRTWSRRSPRSRPVTGSARSTPCCSPASGRRRSRRGCRRRGRPRSWSPTRATGGASGSRCWRTCVPLARGRPSVRVTVVVDRTGDRRRAAGRRASLTPTCSTRAPRAPPRCRSTPTSPRS